MKLSRTLLQTAIFPGGLLFLLAPVYSETSTILYTGMTHTSNLEVQVGNDIQLDDEQSLTRTGLNTGLSLSKRSLDYTGGYILQVDAAYNKDLSASDDISRVSLSASKLSALNSSWLLRHHVKANRYNNEALPTSSYKGLLLESTLGYLDHKGGGTDFSLSVKYERHDQLRDDTYDMARSGLAATHYFPHTKEAAYWSLRAAIINNNASDSSRDYDSLRLGVNLNQITWASFKGQLGFSWQNDNYNQAVLLSPMGSNTMPNMGMMPDATAQKKQRQDNLYSLSFQLGKTLTPALGLQFSGSLRRFDSENSASTNTTDNNSSDDFYSLAVQLAWKL